MSTIASHSPLHISTNSKWPMGDQMVTWPMTSRDPDIGQTREPNTLRAQYLDAILATIALPNFELLWGRIKVGYPSDSLASRCLCFYSMSIIVICIMSLNCQVVIGGFDCCCFKDTYPTSTEALAKLRVFGSFLNRNENQKRHGWAKCKQTPFVNTSLF